MGSLVHLALAGCATLSFCSASAQTPDFVLTDPATRFMQPTDLEPSPEPSVVDLGFFYARELQQRGLSLTSLDNTARTMVDFMNTALQTTGVPLSVRVTYAAIFEERLAGVNAHAAHSLLGDTGRALRDTVLTDYGIDAIVLIKATDDVDELFGVATLGTESNLTDPMTVSHAVVCLGAARRRTAVWSASAAAAFLPTRSAICSAPVTSTMPRAAAAVRSRSPSRRPVVAAPSFIRRSPPRRKSIRHPTSPSTASPAASQATPAATASITPVRST